MKIQEWTLSYFTVALSLQMFEERLSRYFILLLGHHYTVYELAAVLSFFFFLIGVVDYLTLNYLIEKGDAGRPPKKRKKKQILV